MKNEYEIRVYMIRAFCGIFIGCLIGAIGAGMNSAYPNLGIVSIITGISGFSTLYLCTRFD
jgi:hypothetical protein